MSYDSRLDTEAHIERVSEIMFAVKEFLSSRAKFHDQSKLKPPEKEYFDKLTPLLKGSTYGTSEYTQFLEELKPALNHHYKKNRHHPEHFHNGIAGMNLIDLMEMFIDWKAASERHEDGDIIKSIEINTKRFDISSQLKEILINTAYALQGV